MFFKMTNTRLLTPLQVKLNILLCPPEKSTHFHYLLDPKKIRTEGSMYKDTTLQGSDRQDLYRHGKRREENRLGLPYWQPSN